MTGENEKLSPPHPPSSLPLLRGTYLALCRGQLRLRLHYFRRVGLPAHVRAGVRIAVAAPRLAAPGPGVGRFGPCAGSAGRHRPASLQRMDSRAAPTAGDLTQPPERGVQRREGGEAQGKGVQDELRVSVNNAPSRVGPVVDPVPSHFTYAGTVDAQPAGAAKGRTNVGERVVCYVTSCRARRSPCCFHEDRRRHHDEESGGVHTPRHAAGV